MALDITERYGKSLAPDRTPPSNAPDWIEDIDNPYIQGLFAPITTEMDADELPVVEGELPRDLQGGYFRNGPNNEFKPTNRYHWFDGDGMIHGVWFEDGKARYANRYIETRGLDMERDKGEAIWPGVLGPFDFSLPHGPLKDTANTDLIAWQGKLLALWYESGQPYKLDANTLETLGVEDFGRGFDYTISAHSKIDEATGELIFFSYGDRPPWMMYGVAKPDGEIHHVEIDLPGPRRPHDIGFTPNYCVLHDFPVFYDPDHFKKTGKRVPLFHAEVPTRYGVIPRFGDNDDVQWFEFEPCYMLHVVNCWEEGDEIVMVGCRTDDPSLKPNPKDGNIAAMLSFLQLQANLYEWRMNVKTGEGTERKLDDLNAEFPRISAGWMGEKNRYSYHQMIPYEIPATFDALVKYDLWTGAAERHDYGEGVYGSEATFAPRVGATEEDDGYVITLVTDTKDWSSQTWVYDAKDIAKGPIAKVQLPQRVPAGFHAAWVKGEEMA